MSKKVRHVLGISGGKDSAALAIYMHKNYPEIDIEYYTCDTGKELEATYKLIDNLENYLGKKIIRLKGAKESNIDPFDHHYNVFGNYLFSHYIFPLCILSFILAICLGWRLSITTKQTFFSLF